MKMLHKILACAVVGAAVNLNAQSVTVDPTTLTLGYMNWTPMPGDAAGYGGTGASAWALSALPATFSGTQLTLSPNVNTYADNLTTGPGGTPNPYWINADGSGANKMDGSVYNETTGTYVGTTLTFTGNVLANSLANGYTSYAFIKDFVSSYASYTTQNILLTTPGVFSISLATSANATDHIQYGFETFGPNANPATVSGLGSITIDAAPVPEPTTLALVGLGGAAALSLIRRRKS